MASLNVLQFDYSIDNEIARNATKDFAQMLGIAFEQYKKLWNEYLKLRKHCEDSDFDIPFQLFESDKYNENNTKSDKNRTSFDSTKESTSKCHNVCTNYIFRSDSISDLDNSVFSNEKSAQNETEEFLGSPVLIKARSKSKRTSIMNNEAVLDNFGESTRHPCVPMKEYISIPIDIPKENIVPEESKKNEVGNYNDEVECAPAAKMPKKLGVSKLYNVDTTLLPDGKKLRQSTIVFVPNEQSSDITTTPKFKRISPLKSHVSPTPRRSEKAKSIKKRSIEDVIKNTPNKRSKPNLKLKSSKLKRKSPMKFADKSNRRENNTLDAFSDKTSITNVAVKEINQSSLSQYLLPLHTSTQNEQSHLTRNSKRFSSCGENIERNRILNSPFCPAIVDTQGSCSDHAGGSTLSKNTEILRSKENINQTDKNKYPELDCEILDSNSSTCNDETFFSLGEDLQEKFTHEMSNIKGGKEKALESDLLSKYQSVKRSLMDSFDILPEKKEVNFDKPSKKQSERAKMTGISCWDCKKYYAKLGLSEKEIKLRQNQCSRHRTKYTQRPDTPEGFWDPVFPDTCSSTYQDE